LALEASRPDGPPPGWVGARRTELKALLTFEELIESAADAAGFWVDEQGGDGEAVEDFVAEQFGLAELRRLRVCLAADLEFPELAHHLERRWSE
jgi:hypothetical protein